MGPSKKPGTSLEIEPIQIVGEFIDDADDQRPTEAYERQNKPRKSRSRSHQKKTKRRSAK